MPLKQILKNISQYFNPSIYLEEQGKRRAVTLNFVLFHLIFSLAILLGFAVDRGGSYAVKGLIAAEVLLVISLLLTWRGHYSIPSHLVPLGLLLINSYFSISIYGLYDTSILGYPLIIALAGLLLGKYGTLIYAMASLFCLYGAYWVEQLTGSSPGTRIDYFKDIILSADLMVIAILLSITAALIYFAINNLVQILSSARISEQVSVKAKKDLEHYTRILENRTKLLLTGTRVSRAASSILDPDELAQQVVDMVSERFGLYYVCLFISDEKREWAILRAATGEAGKQLLKQGHRLKIGSTSMIGWCITHQKARIALDVGKDAVHFDNPLLPLTRSELALPLISRGKVIGGLGIQSSTESAFSEEDIATFQAMADQLAVAISNARHYTQLQNELRERKRIEKEIRHLNIDLEKRVVARTRELQAANENLTILSRIKDEFVANVSHELRTPITSIMLYHSMIEARPEDALKHITHLRRETDRLARLIEDLLYISRLEQGHTQFNLGRLDLNQLARDFITDRLPLAAQHHLEIKLQVQPDLPIIDADDKMIGQVLSILLTNALNYTPPGGVVSVQTNHDQHKGRRWVCLSISDTGPGINADEQILIFERFYRGRAAQESTAPGSGLGLAIARTIVEKHNGRIEVMSSGIAGEGTTFTIWLPVDHPPGGP